MAREDDRKQTLIERLYIISVVIFVITSILITYFVYSNTMDSMFLKIIKYAAIIFAIFKIVVIDFRQYSRKRIVYSLLVLLLVGISSFVSGNKAMLWVMIMVIAAYKVDIRKILKSMFVWETIAVAIIVLLSLFGVIPDRVYSRGGEVFRHSFGFKYCTYLPLLFMTLSTMYLYLRNNKTKVIECLVIIGVAVLLFILTGTRFEPILTICLTIIVFLYNKFSCAILEKIISWSAIVAVPLAVILSVFSVVFYEPSNGFWKGINSFTSDRLNLSSKAIEENGVTLFGNDIQWVGLSHIYEDKSLAGDYNAVDNAYLKILVQFGLIVMAIFIACQVESVCFARKKNDYRLQLILISFVLLSILNPHTYELVFCPFLLLLGGDRVKEKQKELTDEKK